MVESLENQPKASKPVNIEVYSNEWAFGFGSL